MAVTPSAKDATAALASGARRVPGSTRAAGAAAAGLAGGLVLGARISPRRTVLGLPVGRRRRGLSAKAHALAGGARRLGAAAGQAAETADDIRLIREHLASVNRRSPVEILLDALTHRRGAHRLEQ